MLVSKEQQSVPQVSFPTRVNDDWKTVTSEQLFAGKKVILFALPGAFTPTCSSTHLPRYNELADVFKAQGVDDIICLSVNDTFVMNAWAADQDADNITFLPDGNGEFSEKMGMLVDKENLGFGKRSWRYSMLVNDGVIEKMFIEPEVEGDPFEVSDADTMLAYLAPDAVQKEQVSLITKPNCPFCTKAKALLTEKGFKYEELTLGEEVSISSLRALSGRDTVPQVFIDGKHIGGSDDLAAHFA
ncbi:glutathione peroxidase [Endozoicomonas sp. G2_1]|uniref:glutathione peroxidase n=1 Tax=Endozoicomonas sp. G2_1 TaxID=2821091 RepID=UPI001ADA77FA|nr:glutathione peroxidase [Endozoicomonas sp. G2_1]MBO9491786.1 glutathione peroxidase [Endozoicomonas sp. G2_1]